MHVVEVGEVPDEVLLCCGGPASTPSPWWTPSLAAMDERDATEAIANARDSLVSRDLLDIETGTLDGLLGEVATVVAAATVLVLVEVDHGDEPTTRWSVVVSEERVLLDAHDADGGSHHLLLVGPSDAAAWLVELLDPAARTDGLLGDGGDRIVRIVRSTNGDAARSHALTIVEDRDGLTALWAAADGAVLVQTLDAAGLVDVVLGLLGAVEPGGAVAG